MEPSLQKNNYRKKTYLNKKKRSKRCISFRRPILDSRLEPVFKKIGIPDKTSFKADPYQIEALDLIEDNDVLVSAPTGAGKTWIAIQTIHKFLSQGKKVWYASPLKALSNSIYHDFCKEFGSLKCGILTGDRKENPNAPIIVGTTEILRNQLYDAMQEGISITTDLVILDEAHYISDRERGVVWEEILIYMPPRVRLLLLSATISNSHELFAWLKSIRNVPNKVVLSKDRPVHIEPLFLFPDGLMSPLGNNHGLIPNVKKFLQEKKQRKGLKIPERPNFNNILHCLREFNLLPAIFFLKSRADCDQAVMACRSCHNQFADQEEMIDDANDFLEHFPHLKEHRQLKTLLDVRVGSHHGGQLPYWKVLVEKMMNKGYLDAIFSTSTVAAGLNFPARTVVLVQSDRFNGQEFADLTASDLHQMIGRAGRRGKDQIGFALIIPGRHQNPKLIYELKDSSPEPIFSQIHINFSMTLNLLLSHTTLDVKHILDKSFAAYQLREKNSSAKTYGEDIANAINVVLHGGKCDTSDPYEIMEYIQKRDEINAQLKKSAHKVESLKTLAEYEKHLTPGRLFRHKNQNIYMVSNTYRDDDRLICLSYNLKKKSSSRRGKNKLKKVDSNQILAILDRCFEDSQELSLQTLRELLKDFHNDLTPLVIDIPPNNTTDDEDLSLLEERLNSLPCQDCEHMDVCHREKRNKLKQLLHDFHSLKTHNIAIGDALWLNFKRHVRFLKETGFVNQDEYLTADGIWASKLRVDQPLLIAEAIRKGAFHGITAELLAGLLAPFVWDRTLEIELKSDGVLSLKVLEEAFNNVMSYIEEIRTLKEKREFGSHQLLYWPAAALFLWAKGVSWEQLLDLIPVVEGDMASLIMRTADHLRQIVNLNQKYPDLSSMAAKAIDLIQREPVSIP